MISYEEFKKIEVRAGKVLTAEKIPNTDKLLRLTVDFNEKVAVQPPALDPTAAPIVPSAEVAPIEMISKPRQIVSGISAHYPDPSVLIGKTFMFVTNLEPRMIKGFESNGMIFAVSNSDGGFSLLEPNRTITQGSLAA